MADHHSVVNIGLLILAAGGSKRMGMPKQLLALGTTTLLGHAIDIGMASRCNPVVVVLGANAQTIGDTISHEKVCIVVNKNWHLGMGSSIKVGLQKMLTIGNIEGAIIMVCDQPNISVQLLDRMIKLYQQQRPKAVACVYNDTTGVPALFNSALFSELQTIKGDKGARKLLKKYRDQIQTISCPEGALDIDTPKEYEEFISRSKNEN